MLKISKKVYIWLRFLLEKNQKFPYQIDIEARAKGQKTTNNVLKIKSECINRRYVYSFLSHAHESKQKKYIKKWQHKYKVQQAKRSKKSWVSLGKTENEGYYGTVNIPSWLFKCHGLCKVWLYITVEEGLWGGNSELTRGSPGCVCLYRHYQPSCCVSIHLVCLQMSG